MLAAARFLLTLVALVVFVLATFHVQSSVDLVAAGLALYMAAVLAWWVTRTPNV